MLNCYFRVLSLNDVAFNCLEKSSYQANICFKVYEVFVIVGTEELN